MDYEKLHKDTIAKLQEMVNSGKITVKTACGICADFVPESEDEKVRRVLREIVLQWKNGHQAWCSNDKEIDTILAWLEKQGEQNLIMAKSPQLGERKPADETPYPETLEKAIDLYYYSYGNGEGGFEHLSLEKFRDIVHTFVSDYGQKPAWSEEDEDRLNSCVDAINAVYKWDSMIAWLKSIKDRYTWKPSDEQMQALLNAGNSFRPFEECHKVLWSLYNDLKKLREE